MSFLDGELDVLDIAVVPFQVGGQGKQLFRPFRHRIRQRRQRFRRTHSGDHVLALCVGQELAVNLAPPRRGVAGEQHAGAAGGAQVAVDHAHDGDGGAHVVIDSVLVAVNGGSRVVPAPEHRLHRPEKLLPRIVRRRRPGVFAGDVLEVAGDRLQLIIRELVVQFHPGTGLVLRQALLKGLRRDLLHHLGVDLDEAAVGVPGRPPVAHHLAQSFDDVVVDAEVEDGVHHTGHGDAGARAHRHQQGVGCGTKLVPDGLLELGNAFANGRRQPLGQRIVPGQVVAADLRGDHEPRRDRQSQPRHLAEIASLAAEQFRHGGVPFAEPVDHLRRLSLYNHGPEHPSITFKTPGNPAHKSTPSKKHRSFDYTRPREAGQILALSRGITRPCL